MRKYDILMCVTHIMYSLSHQKWTRYCCDLYNCIHSHFVGINTHMLRIYIIFTLVVLWYTRCQRSNPAEMGINHMGQDTTIVRIVLVMCIIQWKRNHISWIKNTYECYDWILCWFSLCYILSASPQITLDHTTILSNVYVLHWKALDLCAIYK